MAIRSGAQSRVAPNMRRAATSQARAPVPQCTTKDGVGLHQEAATVVEASPLPTRPDKWDINVLAFDVSRER